MVFGSFFEVGEKLNEDLRVIYLEDHDQAEELVFGSFIEIGEERKLVLHKI